MKLLSTTEAAKRLGVSDRWVRLKCSSGYLGKLVGGRYVLTETEFKRLQPKRGMGRPRKKH